MASQFEFGTSTNINITIVHGHCELFFMYLQWISCTSEKMSFFQLASIKYKWDKCSICLHQTARHVPNTRKRNTSDQWNNEIPGFRKGQQIIVERQTYQHKIYVTYRFGVYLTIVGS